MRDGEAPVLRITNNGKTVQVYVGSQLVWEGSLGDWSKALLPR